jgi:hypothetical protein
VPTANIKEVMYSFLATELSPGSRKNKISSLCQLLKPNTSPAPRVNVKRNGCSSSTAIYMAQTNHRSRSIATIRAHLVPSRLETTTLAGSTLRFGITIVEPLMPA